jgi:hypothetical protein
VSAAQRVTEAAGDGVRRTIASNPLRAVSARVERSGGDAAAEVHRGARQSRGGPAAGAPRPVDPGAVLGARRTALELALARAPMLAAPGRAVVLATPLLAPAARLVAPGPPAAVEGRPTATRPVPEAPPRAPRAREPSGGAAAAAPIPPPGAPAALLAAFLLLLAGASAMLRLAPASMGPAPFVSLLERPG